MLRLPDPCLVVLVGPAGAGKSTWARRQFGDWPVVSTDAMRGVVGLGEHDQRASRDAFDLVARIVAARLKRRFTTVVDSTGLEGKPRRAWVAAARERGIAAYAVVFDEVDERTVRSRNRLRPHPVPSAAISAQLRSMPAVVDLLAGEGFTAVVRPDDVELVPARFLHAPALARIQEDRPVPLTFGIQIGGFAWPGGAPELAPRLATLARSAEAAGFTTVSVMDHLLQIPQVGPEWEDLPEAWTTLGYLAAVTSSARIGPLVTNVQLRRVGLLAKMAATLDVLSGGRAFCGLGAGWFDRELRLHGYDVEAPGPRLDRLEAVLEALPRWWGPGEPACYPRPLQGRIPIVVGGGGERRTLRLAARHADACNVQGEPDVVARKVEVLRRWCDEIGRDPAEVQVTHLSEARVLRPGVDRYDDVVGTVEEQVGRYRALADAGVQHAVVALHNDGTDADVDAFAPVIEAFRTSP